MLIISAGKFKVLSSFSIYVNLFCQQSARTHGTPDKQTGKLIVWIRIYLNDLFGLVTVAHCVM